VGVYRDCPNFMRCIQLSQERLKLWTSNLAATFAGSIRAKGHKMWRQASVGVSRDCPIFWIPGIISGTGKAKNFKFCTQIHRIAPNKSPLKISGKVTVGVLRDSRKFSGHAIYRAHREVIFAIARLSCRYRVTPMRSGAAKLGYYWHCASPSLRYLCYVCVAIWNMYYYESS